MSDTKNGGKPGSNEEARAWERLDDNDELDDAVIAADDTGMLRGEANITLVETNEKLPPENPED
jgi:hypothetical protein